MSLGQLPQTMLDALNMLPKHPTCVTLFTRHSIRHVSTGQGLAGYDLQLTEEGVELAQQWGQHLVHAMRFSVLACVTSPIQRCIDTASHMLYGGYGDASSIVITSNNLLVEPGSFVENHQLASPFFKDLGAIGFINRLIQNDLPGMKNAAQGVLDIFKMIYQLHQTQATGLNLVVTHDTILAVILSLILGLQEVKATDWPKMMEGMFLWFEGDTFDQSTIHLVWRGEEKKLSIDWLNQQI